MADEAANEPPAELGQLPLRPPPATASADQPTIATSFHRFALLPEEIRRLIWEQACIPTKLQFLDFSGPHGLPRVGRLEDPADAPIFNYPGVHDDLAALIASAADFPEKWTVERPRKFRKFFWCCDLNRISAVCPESRKVYHNLANYIRQSRLKIQERVHVSDSCDIFHFSGSATPASLLIMRPRLCPLNLAIDICINRRQDYEFYISANFILVDEDKKAQHNLPRWLLKAIEWGRMAKKGYGNSPATSLTPSIDDVMINLQNLQAVFLINNDIKLRHTESGGRPRANARPSGNQYNTLVHGMKKRFYAINPRDEDVMKHWDVPTHVWPVLEETKKIIAPSDGWKVNIYLMTSIRQKSH